MQIQNFFKKHVWTVFLTVLFVLGLLVLGNQFNKDYLKGSLPGPADPAESSASFDTSSFYEFEEANLIVQLKDSTGAAITSFDGNLNINTVSGPCSYDNVPEIIGGTATFVVKVDAIRQEIQCEFEVFLSDDTNFGNIAGGPFAITAKLLPAVSNVSSYIQDDNSRKVFVELKNFPKLVEGYTATLEKINLNATTGADIVHLFDNLELAPCDDIDDDLIKAFFDDFAEVNDDSGFSMNVDVEITDSYSIKVFLANILENVKLPPAYKNDVEDLLTCLEDTFQKSFNTVQSTFNDIVLNDIDHQLTQETQRIFSFVLPSTVTLPFNINVQSDDTKDINFLISGNFIEDTARFDLTSHEFDLTPRVVDVVVETKTTEHPEFGEGSLLGYSINQQQGPKLILERGKEYVFNLNTTDHPFYITQSIAGGSSLVDGADALSWDIGVTGNGSTTGQLKFKPDDTTPNTLYYQCGNHTNMGWEVEIVDPELECITPEEINSITSNGANPYEITKDTLLCSGESYTLDNGIVIDGENGTTLDPVTLDCDGVTINGNNLSGISGILINDEQFVEVKNCHVNSYEDGILISEGESNLLENNDITNSQKSGILLSKTNDNTLKSNESSNNAYGIFVKNSDNNILEENDVHDNTVSGFNFDESSNDNILKENIICGHLPPDTTDIYTFNAADNISPSSLDNNQCENWYDEAIGPPNVPDERDAICEPCPEEEDEPFISEEESVINTNNKEYTLTLGNHPDIIDQYKWSETKVRIYSGIDNTSQIILADGDPEECVINFTNGGGNELDCTDGSANIDLDLYTSTADVIDAIKEIEMTDYDIKSIDE